MNELKTLDEAQALQDRIQADIAGTDDITCTVNAGADQLWCAVWNKGELMFTVNSIAQWETIFSAFRLLFSGPSEATIMLMFADSEDCIF